MKLHTVNVDEILISKTRYRKEFIPEKIIELASSIAEHGLIQPVVVRKDPSGATILVAGERRIKAMQHMWFFEQQVKCGEYVFGNRQVPCLYLGELDELSAKAVEIEENVRRVDFTWQERANAVQELMLLREKQAASRGIKPPTTAELAEEIHGEKKHGSAVDQVRQELIVARHLTDPDISKAKSTTEAFKILKRKEQISQNARLAAEVGVTFNASMHSLFNDDCRNVSGDIASESIDVIVTDPPYGIDADTYGDSGGAGGSKGEHFYDDSWSNWNKLMQWFAVEAFRVAKPHSHCYVFCDVDNFVCLKQHFTQANWNVFRTPLVWINPQGARAPWPEKGPQRKYQICLYAIKGDRPTSRLLGDVLTYSSDPQLNHPAQKPVALYLDLLKRSANPGDTVADFFMGTGPIIVAGHELKCKVIGIEMDQAAYGTAVKRLQGLK